MPKYYHLTKQPISDPYPLPHMPPQLIELYEDCVWPSSIDILLPENVNNIPQTGTPCCRCPTEWLSEWYGMGSAEKEIANMVLQDVLGYNPYQHFYKGWGVIHWWQTVSGDTVTEQARALNEMNYRLGYTENFWVTVTSDWTGIPF